MARYAILKDTTVENVIDADEDFIAANYPDAIKCPLHIGIGDEYIDGEFHIVNTEVPLEAE